LGGKGSGDPLRVAPPPEVSFPATTSLVEISGVPVINVQPLGTQIPQGVGLVELPFEAGIPTWA